MHTSNTQAEPPAAAGSSSAQDLYTRLKQLQRHLEFLDIQARLVFDLTRYNLSGCCAMMGVFPSPANLTAAEGVMRDDWCSLAAAEGGCCCGVMGQCVCGGGVLSGG